MNENIEDILKYMLVLFQNTNKRLEELQSKQSEWDIKQDELLHYIENHNLDAIKSCKIVKQLKYVRYERRQIKNEIEIIKSLKDTFMDKYKNKFIEKDIIQAIQNVKRLENKHNNPSYRYKYIDENLEINNPEVNE